MTRGPRGDVSTPLSLAPQDKANAASVAVRWSLNDTLTEADNGSKERALCCSLTDSTSFSTIAPTGPSRRRILSDYREFPGAITVLKGIVRELWSGGVTSHPPITTMSTHE